MIRFIDLFSGLGGTRLGLEAACDELGIEYECVLSSDKKRWAQTAYKHNFHDDLEPDVTKIDEKKMPDFDFMLGGFPCLTADTFVTMHNGKQKKIVDVKVGDRVITRGGMISEVLTFMPQGEKEVFLITCGKKSIKATANHRFLCCQPIRNGEKVDWVSVQEMLDSPGQYSIGTLDGVKRIKETFLSIDSIVPAGIEKVYDIEVGYFHSFIANDFISHNCQPFSRAGNKKGFADTRGTMFFELERILKEKKPKYLLLENVPEILTNDSGRTIAVITATLENLGYGVSVNVLNGKDFGLPQERRRAFITGILDDEPLDFTTVKKKEKPVVMKDIMERGFPLETDFTKALLSSYKASDITGYVISDKRRGNKTLHSWDIALHGKVTKQEKDILETILSEFRKRKYAEELGIRWRDGMPLNLSQLSGATGIDEKKLEPILERLVDLGYLTKKHPFVDDSKEQRTDLPIGYKLITSRVSFELNRFLGPDDTCVTLTATDASHIGIIDGSGVRRLTMRECLRLFGFPETYDLSCVSETEAYDLVGNSICVPVVKAVAKAMLSNDAR